MSAVYWHSRDHGEAALRGSERAYARCLAADMAEAIAWPKVRREEAIRQVIVDPPDYLDHAPDWLQAAETWLRLEGRVRVGGDSVELGDVALNTLIATGSRQLRLLAWMHGMCENHGYFEPDAHAALAETITDGREANLLREGQGWEDVLGLIARVDGAGPIVWSYSVCESFPDRWELRPPQEGGESDENYEERVDKYIYDELTPEAAWDQAIELLRAKAWPVALHPDSSQGFVNGKSAFDLAAEIDAAAVANA
jgi:hypothetical protein